MVVPINEEGDVVFEDTARELQKHSNGQRRSAEYSKLKGDKVSLAVGVDPNVAAEAIFSGQEETVDNEVRKRVVENVGNRMSDRVTDIVAGESDDDITQVGPRYETDIEKARTSSIPEMDVHLLGDHPANSVWNEVNTTHQRRVEMAKKMFGERFEQDSGFFNAVGDFLDIMISAPYTEIISGGGFTRGNVAERMDRLITNTDITDEEFRVQFGVLIEEMADEGLFTETNSMLLGQVYENWESGDSSLDEGLTVAEFGLLGMNIFKRLLKARTAIDVADSVSRDQKLRTDMRVNGAVSESDPNSAVHTAPASISPNSDRINLSAPDNNAMRRIEEENEVGHLMDELDWGFTFQQEDIDRVVPRIKQELADTYKDNVRLIDYNVIVDDKRGNAITRVAFGKSTKEGAVPFKFMKIGGKERKDVVPPGAKRLAEEYNATPVRTEDGWIVVREDNIKPGQFVSELKENEITTTWLGLVGSAFMSTSKRLDAILKRGEAQIGVIDREVTRAYQKVMNSLPKIEKAWINKFFEEYRDGTKSHRTKPLTVEDFENDYHSAFGKNPSPKTVEAFRQTQELNDAAYWVEANRRFRLAVEQGEQVAKIDGTEVRVRKAPNVDVIPANRHVFDIETGTKTPIGKLDKKKTVFEVSGGYDTGTGRVMYVTGDLKTRRLYHSDVLGYNAGGPRIYDQSNWFLKQDRQLSFSDGTSIPAAPRTFMTTFTEAEADQAVMEINGMLAELRGVLPGLKTGKFADHKLILQNAKDSQAVQDILNRTAGWNVNIEDTDDLIEFFERYRLDFKKDVGKAADKEQMLTPQDDGQFSFVGGYGHTEETFKDVFIKQSNSKRRRDIPLIGYGGTNASTYSPLEAIQRSFTRAVNGRAEEAYVINAVGGWLKHADRYITNKQELIGMSDYAKLRNAKLSKTQAADALRQEQNVIVRRVENHSGAFTDKWESTMQRLGEYIYDKGSRKTGVALSNKYSADPTIALRSLAFDLKLGLFAFPQLIVQTSHLLPILAIAGGPNGIPGLASVLPVRMAIANGTPQMAKYLDGAVGGMLGFRKGEFEEFIGYLKRSGRMEIGQTVIEQNEDYTMALGHVNRVRKVGRMFFEEGERIPRIAAATIAWREYRKQFPNGNPLSQEGVLWMARRQDVLTAGMTRASSTAWQKNSLLSVPTQFLSYSSRMMEQIFTNKILNRGERFRLATIQLATWGFTGAGMGWAFDHLVGTGYLDIDRDAYTVMRYGILDWVIGEGTGARTAFAERLSVGEGFYDVFKKISQDSMVEVLGGPSISVATDVSSSIIQAIGDAIHGRTDMLTYDVGKIIRNASGPNTLYNSWYLARVGEYYSRNSGNLIAQGLGIEEALFNAMGAPLQDVSLGYRLLELRRNEKQRLLEHGKRIQEKWNLAAQAYESGDPEGAHSIMNDIGADMAILNGYERDQMKRFMGAQSMSLFEKAIKDAILNPEASNHHLGKLLAEDMQTRGDDQ